MHFKDVFLIWLGILKRFQEISTPQETLLVTCFFFLPFFVLKNPVFFHVIADHVYCHIGKEKAPLIAEWVYTDWDVMLLHAGALGMPK